MRTRPGGSSQTGTPDGTQTTPATASVSVSALAAPARRGRWRRPAGEHVLAAASAPVVPGRQVADLTAAQDGDRGPGRRRGAGRRRAHRADATGCRSPDRQRPARRCASGRTRRPRRRTGLDRSRRSCAASGTAPPRSAGVGRTSQRTYQRSWTRPRSIRALGPDQNRERTAPPSEAAGVATTSRRQSGRAKRPCHRSGLGRRPPGIVLATRRTADAAQGCDGHDPAPSDRQDRTGDGVTLLAAAAH